MNMAGLLLSIVCTVFTFYYFVIFEPDKQKKKNDGESAESKPIHALGIFSKVIDWELPQLDDPREFNRLNAVLWDGQRIELIVEAAGTSRAVQLKAKGIQGETLVHPGLDWAYFSYDRNSGLMQFRYRELVSRREGSKTIGFQRTGAGA